MQQLNILGTLDYIINKIIFIDSGTHIYSELELNKDLVLFGKNNKGKTSSLVATKLLLYPEVNFNDCNKKFHFSTKDKEYTKDDSYSFYFPTSESYIIMESSNPSGTSCMILYRMSNYEYGRLLISANYDTIRDIFWDLDNPVFNKKTSVKEIQNELNSRKIKYKNVTTKDELKRLLYSNVGNSDSIYCIVPLKSNDDNSIQAFINIYDIAFSQNASTDTLPNAIATIIEMQRSREQEKLNTNFQELRESYQSLVNEKNNLEVCENQQEIFEDVEKEYERFIKNNNEFVRKFVSYSARLNIIFDYTYDKVRELQRKQGELEDNVAKYSAEKNNLSATLKKEKHQKEVHEEKIKELQGQKIKIEKTLNAYSVQSSQALSTHELIDYVVYNLKNKLDEKNAVLDAIKDINSLSNKLQKINLDIQKLKKENATLNMALENTSSLSISTLDPTNASIITSLIPSLITCVGTLTDNESAIFNSFISLFEIKDNGLCFKGQNLVGTKFNHFDIDKKIDEIKLNITRNDNLISQYTSNENELRKAFVALNNGSLGYESKALIEKEITSINNDMMELNGYPLILNQIEKTQEIVSQIELKIKNYSEKLSGVSQKFDQFLLEANTSKNHLNSYLALQDKSRNQLNVLNNAGVFLDKEVEQHIEKLKQNAVAIDDDFVFSEKITQDEISDLMTFNRNIVEAGKGRISISLTKLMSVLPNDNVDKDKQLNTIADIENIITSYRNIFHTLKLKKDNLMLAIITHNSYLVNMLDEIKQSYHLIDETIKDINASLKQHEVSNFKAVQLEINTRSDFKSIIKASEKIDIAQPVLVQNSFYNSLIEFMQSASNKSNSKLKMADIIESVNYVYVHHNDEKVKTGQSGGTTTTANCIVISCLLGRIFDKHSRFKMPIVVDEVSQIDENNLSTLVNQIHGLGFSIYCATPSESTITQINIGRWVNLDACSYGVDDDDKNARLYLTHNDICTFSRKNITQDVFLSNQNQKNELPLYE